MGGLVRRGRVEEMLVRRGMMGEKREGRYEDGRAGGVTRVKVEERKWERWMRKGRVGE